jgi:hypothetical protein
LGLADFPENHAIFIPKQNCTGKKPCFVLVSNDVSPNSKKAIIHIISFLVNFFVLLRTDLPVYEPIFGLADFSENHAIFNSNELYLEKT